MGDLGPVHYSDPQVAAAAADAAMSAIESDSIPEVAAIDGHRAAINQGGEYRCRPDRTGAAIAVCVLLALLFVPATLFGLSNNPSLGRFRESRRCSANRLRTRDYSHSMVPGGLLVMSKTTRFTPFTSFTIRLLMRASTSYGTRAQSAVIASSLVTTLMATTFAYVL